MKKAKPPVSWQSLLSSHELSVSCAWTDSTPSSAENRALIASSTNASSNEPTPASGGGIEARATPSSPISASRPRVT